MIAPEHSQSVQPQEHRKTPAARLEESLRDLVQEEMGVVRAESRKLVASRSDACWLFLCVADAGLILWLLPDAVLGDKRLELVIKLFTWLGGSLFVLGYVWFRELFLAFVRNRAFKILLAGIPVLVFPSYVTQAPIFYVKPQVDPPNAEVVIKGRPAHINGIRLPLQSQEAVVSVPGEGNNAKVYTDKFALTASDIWRTWWRDEQPYFALPFYVPLIFPEGAPETIVLAKEGNRFDSSFKSSTPQLTFQNENGVNDQKSGTWMNDGRISFSVPDKPPLTTAGVTLPYGKYGLTATFPDKPGCDKTKTVFFMAKPGVELPDSEVILVERTCGGKK